MAWPHAAVSGFGGDWNKFQEVTLTGTALDVTITVPSGGARFVRVIAAFEMVGSGTTNIVLNGITSGDYHVQNARADGVLEQFGRTSSGSSWFISANSTFGGSTALIILTVFGGREKLGGFSQYCGTDSGGTDPYMQITACEVAATGPVTSIKFIGGGQNYNTDSVFIAEGVGDE